jgi:putative membrane protein
MLEVRDLPALNAALNLTSAILLGTGYYFIRKRNIPAHRACMVAALFTSTAFLTSYLIYHAHVLSVPFTKQGWIRPVYYSILLTHVLLAIVILPLVLRTSYLAFRKRFDKHVRIARWTFPLWMYVSVTGVIVYIMLYQL